MHLKYPGKRVLGIKAVFLPSFLPSSSLATQPDPIIRSPHRSERASCSSYLVELSLPGVVLLRRLLLLLHAMVPPDGHRRCSGLVLLLLVVVMVVSLLLLGLHLVGMELLMLVKWLLLLLLRLLMHLHLLGMRVGL